MTESKPTLVRYVGPIDEVYAVDLGVHVKRGKTVEVPTKALARRLLAQEGTWEAVDQDDDGKAETMHKPVAGTKED